MSRLGKKPIQIPEGVEINVKEGVILVKGPKGELSRNFNPVINIEIKEKDVVLNPKEETPQVMALWGTYSSHIRNMIAGVTEGFSKTLLIEGVGFKAQMSGENLVLNLGFSHPIEMKVPEGAEVKVEKNKIEIFGIDKELVGETAAKIRAYKKPEPYKGKGIRYEDEVVRRKAGKKVVGT